MTPSDEHFARILLETRSIAMVGASVKPHRPSHRVGNYLASVGYRVLAVNPGHAGEKLFGETVRASLADIDIQIDLVSVFCRSDRVPGVVEAALGALPDLKVIWMQEGVADADARKRAEEQGIEVIENTCIATMHRRLLGPRAAS